MMSASSKEVEGGKVGSDDNRIRRIRNVGNGIKQLRSVATRTELPHKMVYSLPERSPALDRDTGCHRTIPVLTHVDNPLVV